MGEINWGEYVPPIVISFLMIVSFFGMTKFAKKEDTQDKLIARIDNLVNRGDERDRKITEITRSSIRCQQDVGSLETVIDGLTNENKILSASIEKLKGMYEEQSDKIAALTEENRETADVAYLMLRWIKDAVQRFEMAKLEPPEIPRDFIIFGNKYKGKFKD